MPKIPIVSGKEAIQAFKKLGFVVDRQKGSHVILKKVTPHGVIGCVIPMHKEIDPYTLRSALRQAGVSVDTFQKAV